MRRVRPERTDRKMAGVYRSAIRLSLGLARPAAPWACAVPGSARLASAHSDREPVSAANWALIPARRPVGRPWVAANRGARMARTHAPLSAWLRARRGRAAAQPSGLPTTLRERISELGRGTANTPSPSRRGSGPKAPWPYLDVRQRFLDHTVERARPARPNETCRDPRRRRSFPPTRRNCARHPLRRSRQRYQLAAGVLEPGRTPPAGGTSAHARGGWTARLEHNDRQRAGNAS